MTMSRIMSILVFSVLMTGCANGKFNTLSITGGACPGTVSGYTFTYVAYGTGALNVIPISNIRANTEWRFYLKPIDKLGGALYRAKTVTVAGKPVGSLVPNSTDTALVPYAYPGPPGNDTWLSATGSYNIPDGSGPGRTGPYIVACVDPAVLRNQEWHFEVTVEDVGKVDPRGRVL